jgi:hypothetical protein
MVGYQNGHILQKNRFDRLELSNIGLDSNKGHILLDLITVCFQEQEKPDSIYAVGINDSISLL